MKKQTIFKELFLIALAVLPIIFLLINWNNLPEQMPVHFDVNGSPNGYGSKLVFIFLPIGIYLLMLVLPYIDPRKSNYDLFSDTYFKVRLVMGLFIGMINSAIIYNELHKIEKLNTIIPAAVFLIFTVIGNYMGTIRPNYFVGIKVPWTLNSDEVWTKTHRFAGKLWFWGGITGIAAQFLLPKPSAVMLPIILIITLIPIIYSYIIYQKIGKDL